MSAPECFGCGETDVELRRLHDGWGPPEVTCKDCFPWANDEGACFDDMPLAADEEAKG